MFVHLGFVDVGEIESARWELGDNVKLVNVTSFKFVNPLEGLTGETEILEGRRGLEEIILG